MDVVIVTYNSEKWIERCIQSLYASKNREELNIYMVDNSSSDNTVCLLREFQNKGLFNNFEIIEEQRNKGFGAANNIGALAGEDEIICFINIDTEVFEDTFSILKSRIAGSAADVAAWEFRQLPYEHPKLYNPVTSETSWMSGAAFAIRRTVFQQIGGFDEKIFMYAEDVDLSWRLRAAGYRLRYCPDVWIRHYSYLNENEVKPTQYVNSLINNLLLRQRYGTFREKVKGYVGFLKVLAFYKPPYSGAKKELWKGFCGHISKIPSFQDTALRKAKVAKFLGWDYEIIRDGAFVKCEKTKPDFHPLVSIIVRTCQRPEVLRETLMSIKNQTYDNIEIIVVEDGETCAEQMIKQEFATENIRYFSTGNKVGRSKAGNLGLEKARGEYLNFLDDDDLFFADHVETLVNALAETKNLAVYAFGFETPVIVVDKNPYKYQVKGYNKRYRKLYDEVELCYHNLIPIQCIMFSKQLYKDLGGFDTSLDYLEDWDLWVRYAQKTRYSCVEKTTSIYKVPFEQNIQNDRQKKLDDALSVVRKKHESYYIPVSAARLAAYGKKESGKRICSYKYNR